MSRVGKAQIKLPSGVSVNCDGAEVKVKGKLGEHVFMLPDCVSLSQDGDGLLLAPANDDQKTRSLWGTFNRLLANAVHGVSEGFKVELEINGVGFRAQVKGNDLVMQLGFSHDVVFPIPSDVRINCSKPTSIEVTGSSKERVGQVAAEIRAKKKPEPYKGKGIKYANEVILRKEGKKK